MSIRKIIGTILKPLLFPFSIIYGAVMWVRNKFYDTNLYASVSFSIPVIAVGNLTVGGTGKTPHIEYLLELLRYNYQVATMSRGYKRHTKGFKLANDKSNAYEIGDEPMQFYLKFPEATVSVCEERLTGIPFLLTQQPNLDVILLDDAFQHRSVKPGLNILLTDYYHPFYKDYILPFGRLRESRKAYKRADIIIVSKCPATIHATTKQSILNQIKPLAHQQVYFSTIQYAALQSFYDYSATIIPHQADVLLVSGIAKPELMLQYLEQQARSVHLLKYADHHYFSTTDLEEIKKAFENLNGDHKIIVTTEKDAMRLRLHYKILQDWRLPLYILPIKVRMLDRENELNQQILQYIEQERIAAYEEGVL